MAGLGVCPGHPHVAGREAAGPQRSSGNFAGGAGLTGLQDTTERLGRNQPLRTLASGLDIVPDSPGNRGGLQVLEGRQARRQNQGPTPASRKAIAARADPPSDAARRVKYRGTASRHFGEGR